MKFKFGKALLTIGIASSLVACSSVPLDDSASGGAGAQGSGSATGSGVMDPFNPNSVLATDRSVYFEFDSFTVDTQYQPIVETHARYLASNPQQKILIEGNTDARGGSEYNLALGNRRAESVRSMMTLIGAQDIQIETISFGQEKPQASGDTEAAYAENRRADIVYLRQ
jgi:peptidoglycan-associated lipoprotein